LYRYAKVNMPQEWVNAEHWGEAEIHEEDCRDAGAVGLYTS
jgi:hypothetical protein